MLPYHLNLEYSSNEERQENTLNKKKKRREVQLEMLIAIEHVFRPLMRMMFFTADREGIRVLQRDGIFVER